MAEIPLTAVVAPVTSDTVSSTWLAAHFSSAAMAGKAIAYSVFVRSWVNFSFELFKVYLVMVLNKDHVLLLSYLLPGTMLLIHFDTAEPNLCYYLP